MDFIGLKTTDSVGLLLRFFASTEVDHLARYRRRFFFATMACFLSLCSSIPSFAQVGSTVPRDSYYLAKRDLYAGQFLRAERGFTRSLNSAVKFGNRRWIDSICSYSMLGEIYYRQGKLAASLQSHELALGVFLTNQDWLVRLRYPQIVQSADRIQARIGWGQRPTLMGSFPDSMGSQEGNDIQAAFQFGGALNAPNIRSVDAVEVAYCLANSLRRRSHLLGDACSVSPMSPQLTAAISRTNPPGKHWVNAWIEVLFGLGKMNENLHKQAVGHLATGILAGNFDHPLTGIALLEIGRFHLKREQYLEAVAQLHQASLAAARFRQADIVEEAMKLMTDAYLAGGLKGPFPAIANCLPYARREEFGRLMIAVQLAQAEILYYQGNPLAVQRLNEARAIMSRSDQLPTDLGKRLNYISALTLYSTGQRAAATKALQVAVASEQQTSLRQFHLAAIENLRAGGRRVISPRDVELLYSRNLSEPRDRDWRNEPLETLSWLLFNHEASMSRWFELLIDIREEEKAVAVAEQLKRHRFYAALPLGGRLLSLRWLTEGDGVMLGKRSLKLQKELKTRFPRLDQLSRQSMADRAQLLQLPLLPTEDEDRKLQRKLFDQLREASMQQETMSREIALRREPTPLVFPPQPSLEAIQSAVKDDQAVLMFVTTSQGWHAWFIREGETDYWPIRKPKAVRGEIQELLRNIGNYKRDATITVESLQKEDWKKNGKQLWKLLIGKLPSNGWDGLEELVIIPDGPLWYLPFELLRVPGDQIPDDDEESSLISLTRIRYAPLASLSVGDRRGLNQETRTCLVGGQLFPGESSMYAMDMLTKLKTQLPDLEIVSKSKTPPISSGYFGTLLNRMIVWGDLRVGSNPFGWTPAYYDRKSTKHTQLGDWMEYPWGAPDQVILPGYHTAAEIGMGRKSTGNEVFLSVCGLMATGTRTALLSRWRTGGQMPALLIGEFAHEMTKVPVSKAWREATEIARGQQLTVDKEPRLRGDEEQVSADHPFFWAGYMLIDTGGEPKATPQTENVDPEEKKEAPAGEDGDDPGNEVEAPEAGGEKLQVEEKEAKGEEPPPPPVPNR